MTVVDDQSTTKEKEVNHVGDPASDSPISEDHKNYLLRRHGTLKLNPLPSSSPEDPLNWPARKKNTQVLMVAFHAMMTTFMTAGIIPGFHTFAEKYGTSIEEASYLTSVQVSRFRHILLQPLLEKSFDSLRSFSWASSLSSGIRFPSVTVVVQSSSFQRSEAASAASAVFSAHHTVLR